MSERDDDVPSGDRRALERKMREAGRLPPGQALTLKWPVLHVGAAPAFDPGSWDFRVGGLVEEPVSFTYPEFMALPKGEIVSDFHCVTRWSAFDNHFEGVPVREVLSRVRLKPSVSHVMVLGHVGETRYGYSTNLPLPDFDRKENVFAFRRNGRDLEADHGWPLRLVVPHLYAWKSCKWVRGLIFMDEDKAGYWERLGYHSYGDPFLEQRFSTD